jgi:hypothetical protein
MDTKVRECLKNNSQKRLHSQKNYCIHFQFRVIVKFNEESESGEKKIKKVSFWA